MLDTNWGDGEPVSVEAQRTLLDERGCNSVGDLVPLQPGHAVLLKCRSCGIQKAKQLIDVGCHCTRVTRTGGAGNQKTAGTQRGVKNLFVDSDSPAIRWWDHIANPASELKTATLRATRSAHWVCPGCQHQFEEQIYAMAQSPRCPACRDNEKAEYERLRTVTVSDIPALLAAWDDEHAEPRTVMVAGNATNHRFTCPAGHYPRMNPYLYLIDGCSICRAQATRRRNGKPTLASALPEIAGQWHSARNGDKFTPETIAPTSRRTFWWRSDCCGYEWVDSVRNRDKYERWRCPQCQTILHSLAWQDPGLAAEWSPENPITPWQLRPFATTAFQPKWICSVDNKHRWGAALSSRSAGSGCRECQVHGKSKVELDHFEAAKRVFSFVRSGVAVTDKAFETRKTWSLDMLVEQDGIKMATEYDGAYWHRPDAKALVDTSKSRDLLAAGYLVVRLREDDLPALSIKDPMYLELQVYSGAPQPERIIAEVAQWRRDGNSAS